MATHKHIEENGIESFELAASFPSSGGYDVKAVQEYFFEQEVYHQPFYMAYVALAYQQFYDFENDLSCYFNEPYASAIPAYFDGKHSSRKINMLLNDTLSALIKSDFLKNYAKDLRFKEISEAFEENSLLDWIPTIRMSMYHGEADKTVPYQNSVRTYEYFLSHGVADSIVTLTTLPQATHNSGILPYVEHFVGQINRIEKGKSSF